MDTKIYFTGQERKDYDLLANSAQQKRNVAFKYLVGILIIVGAIILASVSLKAQVATLQSVGSTTICSGESTSIEVVITASVGPYTVVYSDGSTNFTEAGYNSDEFN